MVINLSLASNTSLMMSLSVAYLQISASGYPDGNVGTSLNRNHKNYLTCSNIYFKAA